MTRSMGSNRIGRSGAGVGSHHPRSIGNWARHWIVPPIMTFWATGEKRFCAAATGGLCRNARFISRYGPGNPRGFPLPWDAG